MQKRKWVTRKQLLFAIITTAVSLWVINSNIAAVQAQFSEIGPFSILTEPKNLDQNKIKLGKALFHDVRLSANNTVSCATCHSLSDGGDDGQQFAVGVSGKEGVMNSPTIFNLEGHLAYFWDGRASTLENQLDGPIHNPDEMALSWPLAVKKISASQSYLEQFANLYDEGITEFSIKDAISTFERSLITADSPFDLYLAGDKDALSLDAQSGMNQFSELGCISCHHGPLLGATLYQRIGIFQDYYSDERPARPTDLGRFTITQNEADKYYFKVPSLRNVALTAPYFHDGSQATLEDAVNAMAYYQLGRHLSESETANIVAFLNSLTSPTLAGFADR